MVETPLWSISRMLSIPGKRNGYEFRIIISPQLVQKAKIAMINKVENRQSFNKLAVEMVIQSAGYPNLSPYWTVFGYHKEFGINQINHPSGDGRWLSVSFGESSSYDGAVGDSHNIDNSAQQSLLLALWTL